MAQIINEQDIINAICLSQAYYQNIRPEDVLVELTYESVYLRGVFSWLEVSIQLK